MNLGKRGLNSVSLGQRGAHLTFGACSHRLPLRSRPELRRRIAIAVLKQGV
jgi:hypothetical protein